MSKTKIIITGFKKEFTLGAPCLVDVNDNFSIDAYLKRFHRSYVISKKMQNQVLRRNYTLFED